MEKYVYHITTSKNSKKIEKSGILIGSKSSNRGRYQTLSENGYIYTTNVFNKYLFDKIRRNQILKSNKEIYDVEMNRSYVVYGIKLDSFIKRGLVGKSDYIEGLYHYGLHTKFKMRNTVIPLSELYKVGEFQTNNDNCGYQFNSDGYFINDEGNLLINPFKTLVEVGGELSKEDVYEFSHQYNNIQNLLKLQNKPTVVKLV